jgi:hypothetical protein
MQHEFEPNPDSSFKQGLYSGYAFGLQDGFKYASQQPLSDEEIYEWARKNHLEYDRNSIVIGAKAYRDGKIKK